MSERVIRDGYIGRMENGQFVPEKMVINPGYEAEVSGNGTGMMQSTGTSNVPLFTNNNASGGMLAQLMGGLGNQGILAQSRNNSRLSLTPPDMRIGMNERLMRVGGAGLAADGMTPNQMLGSMLEQNAVVDDLNRQNALDEYNAQVKALNPFMKAASKGKKREKLSMSAIPDTMGVMNALDKAMPRVLEDADSWLHKNTGLGGSATGLGGAILSAVPATDAYNLKQQLTTLKANIGFDKLQRMRDASPTGGALGQVSQLELIQLNATLGSLEQAQDPTELYENLRSIRQNYMHTIRAIYDEYREAFEKGLIEESEWEVVRLKLEPIASQVQTMTVDQVKQRTGQTGGTDYSTMGEDELVDALMGN